MLDESDENSAAAAEALVADTERRTQAWDATSEHRVMHTPMSYLG